MDPNWVAAIAAIASPVLSAIGFSRVMEVKMVAMKEFFTARIDDLQRQLDALERRNGRRPDR